MSLINDENILYCDKKKNIPLLLCNFSKHHQQNNDIFTRNFCNSLEGPIMPYRCSFKICNEQIDLNDIKKTNFKNKICNFKNIKNKFIPGKGHGTDFLKNIDVDSELKSLDYKKSRCNIDEFNPIYTRKNQFNTNKGCTNAHCQEKINDICENNDYFPKLENIVDKNYCYVPNNTKINNTDCLNKDGFTRCSNKVSHKHPILYQQYRNNKNCECRNNNHNCENIWNNNTNRKLIYST